MESWHENDIPDRGELVSHFAEEFLRNLTEDRKSLYRRRLEGIRRRARGLAHFTIPSDEIRQGRLISFSEIMHTAEEIRLGYTGISCRFVHEGRTYCVDDLYCPNPSCKCDEVILVFLEYRETGPDTLTASEVFVARLTFKNKFEIVKTCACSMSQARKLFSEWRASYPDFLDEAKRRYRDVQKVGERILNLQH